MARVLAVDDERDVLSLIALTLELDGHEVMKASDGMQGLQLARKELPDLIVLDVMMPKMDGLTTLRQLREDSSTRDVPVLLLSAKAQSLDIEVGMKAGAVGYMTKPFDPEDLSKEVARIIGG